MRFRKIKLLKGERISAVYEKRNLSGTWDEYSFNCSDQALPEFYEALEALAQHVIELCELPATYTERIKVKGVSFSSGGDAEVMGATISAEMELDYSNCGLNLNTPHKPSAPYSDAEVDGDFLLSDDCIEALNNLVVQTEAYARGERAQMSLFETLEREAV